MITITSTVTGLSDATLKFWVMPIFIKRGTDKVLGNFVSTVARENRSQKYPPELPNQRYVRTGRFGRGWTSGRIAQNRHYIDNTASARGRLYARYVVGNSEGGGQARIHQGRWRVFRKDLDARLPKLVKELDDEIKRISQ